MNAHERFLGFDDLGNASWLVDRIVGILDTIPILDGFVPAQIETLAHYLHCYRVPAGVDVIVEGEPGDFMLLLIDGRMEITKTGKNGLPVHVGEARAGKTLGEMSIIDGEERFASCVTSVQSTIAVLERKELLRLVAEEPQLGLKFVMQMAALLNQRLRQISVEYLKCLAEKERLSY